MSKSASQGMPQFDGSLLRSKEPKKHVILVAFSPPFCLLYLSLSLSLSPHPSHSITTPTWLPDGYIKISRLYVFDPSGLKDYGCATQQNLIPFFPWIASS